MEYSNQDVWSVLFDPNEYTCYSPAHAKGTQVYPVGQSPDGFNFFCINPLNPSNDLNPTESYHAAHKPRRADHNVVKYRNFLIECDKISLEEQTDLIRNVKKLPYATAIYSGGKSIHFIISLDKPVATREEYDDLARRIVKAIGGKDVVDVANKNPSRLSRCPNVFREDKGRMQSLIEVKQRISLEALEQWLVSNGCPKAVKTPYTVVYTDKMQQSSHLSGYTMNLLMDGAQPGERNQSVFKAACDFAKCGYDLDIAMSQIGRAVDLPERELMQTVKNAYKKALK